MPRPRRRRCSRPPGAIDDLIWGSQSVRGVLSFEGTDCSRRHDAIYAEFAHRPQLARTGIVCGGVVTGTRGGGWYATGIRRPH